MNSHAYAPGERSTRRTPFVELFSRLCQRRGGRERIQRSAAGANDDLPDAAHRIRRPVRARLRKSLVSVVVADEDQVNTLVIEQLEDRKHVLRWSVRAGAEDGPVPVRRDAAVWVRIQVSQQPVVLRAANLGLVRGRRQRQQRIHVDHEPSSDAANLERMIAGLRPSRLEHDAPPDP